MVCPQGRKVYQVEEVTVTGQAVRQGRRFEAERRSCSKDRQSSYTDVVKADLWLKSEA